MYATSTHESERNASHLEIVSTQLTTNGSHARKRTQLVKQKATMEPIYIYMKTVLLS